MSFLEAYMSDNPATLSEYLDNKLESLGAKHDLYLKYGDATGSHIQGMNFSLRFCFTLYNDVLGYSEKELLKVYKVKCREFENKHGLTGIESIFPFHTLEPLTQNEMLLWMSDHKSTPVGKIVYNYYGGNQKKPRSHGHGFGKSK
jgi:hypothetical protein